MNDEINLLIRSQSVDTPLLKRLRTLRIISIGCLAAITLTAVVLFLLTTLSPLEKLKQEEATANARLDQMKTKMAKLFLVKERATELNTLISARKEFNQIIDTLQEQLPEGATIGELSTDKEQIGVKISADSLEDMEEILTKVAALADEQKEYSVVILKDLSLGETSTYTAELSMRYI